MTPSDLPVEALAKKLERSWNEARLNSGYALSSAWAMENGPTLIALARSLALALELAASRFEFTAKQFRRAPDLASFAPSMDEAAKAARSALSTEGGSR